MNLKLFVLTGFAGLLLSSTDLWAQPGGAGNQAGPPGGRGGRFFGGGGDPNQFFNQLSGGKDVWSRADSDPRGQMIFDRLASRMGVTNGQITRQQFVAYQQQRSGGGGRGSGPGNAPPNAGGNSGGPGSGFGGFGGGRGFGRQRGNPDSTAEGMFQRLDQNGDGYLNYDEMPEDLRIERQKWDTDRNGLIDLNEFKAFYQARVQPVLNGGGTNAAQLYPYDDSAPVEEERKPPVVYRPGKLPKELPNWFSQLDTDHDGQVALYEWKASGRPLDEFDQFDLNKDGFLTVDEVLRSVNKGKENGDQSSQQNYAFSPYDFRGGRFWRGGPPGFGPPGFGGRGGPGGFYGGRGRGGFGPGGGRGRRNRDYGGPGPSDY